MKRSFFEVGPKLLCSIVHRWFYIGDEEIFCTGCFVYSESLGILVVLWTGEIGTVQSWLIRNDRYDS